VEGRLEEEDNEEGRLWNNKRRTMKK